MSDRTKVQIELDDESMAELIEQCVVANLPPRMFLTELVRDVLARAREEDLQIIIPTVADSPSRH